MRVTGTKRGAAAERTGGVGRGVEKTRGSERAFAASSTAQSEPSSTPAPNAGVEAAHVRPSDALSALLALQSKRGGDNAAINTAQNALQTLEALRLGLLAGRLDRGTLRRLSDLAAQARREAAGADPALQAICDEIDLRARVEIAKLER